MSKALGRLSGLYATAEAWHGWSTMDGGALLEKPHCRVDWTNLSTQSGISGHINPRLHRSPFTCSVDLSFSYLYLPTVCSILCHPFLSACQLSIFSVQSSFTWPMLFQNGICQIVTGGHLFHCYRPFILPNWRNNIGSLLNILSSPQKQPI